MTFQNTTNKPLGFGTTIIMPDASAELPEGYGANHPVVKFYIGKGWLKETKEIKESKDTPKAAAPAEGDEPKGFDEMPLNEKISAVKRMNLAPLRRRADKLGIAWTEADTKKILIDQIIAKYQEAGQN